MKRITILVSGSGSNLQTIINSIESGEIPNAKINLVISDRDCYALERAKNHQIPKLLIPKGENFSDNLAHAIPNDTDLIVLAGFLSIISPDVCQKFEKKIINIHPSLLPNFGGKGMWGMNVHKAVIDSKKNESGATVHFVNAGIDKGEIILQKSISLSHEETPESLAKKIQKIEHEILPKAICKVLYPL